MHANEGHALVERQRRCIVFAMKSHVVAAILACAACACGASPPPAAPAPTHAASSAPAPEPAPAAAPAVAADVVTTPVTTVSSEITTPNVVTPDKVIASLRPKFNTCYQDGLKKDPKLEGSVTLSAKIEKDGKVATVTPKMVTGLNAAVIKCLSDQLKAASFAAAGGMNYTTSLDIPVGFSSR
jgi:glucose/arabinose dehydrogenase